MMYRTVPAQQGMYWLREGAKSFFMQPLAFGTLFMLAWLAQVLLVGIAPPIGIPIVLMLTPCISFGLMAAVGEVRAKRFPRPKLLIEGLRGAPKRRRAMLHLGLIYGAVMMAWLVLWLGSVDWESLMKLDGSEAAIKAFLEKNPQFQLRLAMVSFGNVLMLGVATHAGALVYWNRLSAFAAVGTTLAAMFRNAAAFLLFALSLFLGMVCITSLLQFVLMGLGAGALLMPCVFAVVAAMAGVALGGMFQAFVDCYPPPEAPAPASADQA